MSTTTPYGATLDVSKTPAIPMSRLVRVELRKMYDTKAGLWLLGAIVAITAIVAVIFLLTADASDRTYSNMMGVAGAPQGFLLPVLGILLITQEWGQRTGMVTFALVPHRGKVLWSKVIAALVLGAIALVVALALGTLGTALFGGPDAWDGVSAIDPLKFTIGQLSGVLQGLAFGLLFLNTAGAIVGYFAIPLVFSILTGLWSALKDVQPWIDLGTSSVPLFDGVGNLTGEEWAQLGTSSLIWVVIPFALGMWRVLRAEVK